MPNLSGFNARRSAASRRFHPITKLFLAAAAGLALAAGRPAQADARAALPQAIAGFRMTHPPQVFNPGTLENHIDGQAESVKHYQFRQCDYAEYAPGGKGNQLITVDIYEMGTPLDAFGYYSFQLSPMAASTKPVNIGAQGYSTRDGLNFWKGSYYVNVTITAAGSPPAFQAAMPKIGQAIASKLSGSTSPPAMLSLLPPGYAPRSDKYQRVDVAAQQFLQNAVSATYPSAGQQAEMFIAAYPSAAAAKQAYAQYVSYLSKPFTLAPGSKVTPLKGVGESAAAVHTRYRGQVVAAQQGKYVIGISKARDAATAQKLVKAAAARAK